MSTSIPLRCKCRKQAVTSLRCSRCNVPICPDCSRPAPVGMLCRECADNKKSRLYQVSAGSMALATVASLAVATLGGWLLNAPGFSLGFYGLIIAFFYGALVAEVALRITGRKRGIKMEIMAGVCTVVGVLLGRYFGYLPARYMTEDALPILTFFDGHTVLLICLSLFGAVNRIRFI